MSREEVHAMRKQEPDPDRDLDDVVDAALAAAPRLVPRAHLRREVMAAVRQEAPPPLPFPWRRVLVGGSLAAAAAGIAWLLPSPAAGLTGSPAALLPTVAVLAAVPQLLGWADRV